MPVNATIPLTQDFLETAASYPFLTELIQHPTDGYLYGCYHSSALFGSMVKVKADNFADITTVDFANDGQHANPVDMVYVPSTDRFYVLFRNGDANRCVISAVTPSTLARTDFFNFTDIQVGAGSITADATNLYVVTFQTTPSYLVIIPIAAPGTFAEPTPLTGFSQAHCIRQFGGKLFAQGMTPPTTGWVMRLTTAGVVEETATFTGEEGEFPVDEIGESSGHIWVGNRDLLGEIRKYSKTSFINPEVILTTQLSKCTCVKTVGSYVWAAFENGRGVRINPANVADRRIYTLNAGEGYHSEFTGGNEFVYTYNYFEGKVARYHIPPDVVLTPGAAQWIRSMTSRYQLSTGGVVVDRDGNLVTAGNWNRGAASNKLNFVGPEFAAANDIDPTGGIGSFIAKYGADRSLLWTVVFGGSGGAALSVTVDAQSNVYIVGYFSGTTDFTGNGTGVQGVTRLTAVGSGDGYIAKYNSAGVIQWVKAFTSTGVGLASGISIVWDGASNVVAAFNFNSTTNFGGGFVFTQTSGDMALVRLATSDGTTNWALSFGSSGPDTIYSVVADANFVATVGFSDGVINLGGGNSAGGGGFIAKYSTASTVLAISHQWSRVISSSRVNGLSFGLSADNVTNNYFIGGSFTSSSASFGGSILEFKGGAPVAAGFFLAAYSSSGSFLWGRGSGGSGDVVGAVKFSNGNLSITGNCNNVMNFGGGCDRNGQNCSGLRFGGRFIAKYNVTGDNPPAWVWDEAQAAIFGTMEYSSPYLYVAGTMQSGSYSFGNNVSASTAGNPDGFLLKYVS